MMLMMIKKDDVDDAMSNWWINMSYIIAT